MSSTDVQLSLRPPAWAQAWVVAFPVVLVLVGLLVVRPGADTWAVVRGGAVLVFALLLCWRLFRLGAIGTADGKLVVRNSAAARTARCGSCCTTGRRWPST